MIRIFLLLIFAVVIAYIASQNSMAVELRLLRYSLEGVPLYFVIITAVGVGFSVGFVFNLITKFTLYRRVSNKKKQLEESRNEITRLTKKIHQMEIENSELKGQTEEIDEKSL